MVAEGGHRYHRAAVTLDEEEVQVVLVCPVRLVGLDVYAVDTVVHVEVIHIDGACEGLQGGEHIRKRDSEKLYLVPVCIEVQLRDILLHSGCEAGELLSL